MTLVGFLLARIAEDEAVAEQAYRLAVPMRGSRAFNGVGQHVSIPDERFKAECEAKRRIVEMRREVIENGDYSQQMRHWYLICLAYMALPYASHPDYQEAWKP